MEMTELEPINSYYRLLVHRIARYYGIDHTIESERPTIMILSKTLETKVYRSTPANLIYFPSRPLIRLFELLDRPKMVPVANRSEPYKPVSILRRDISLNISSSTTNTAIETFEQPSLIKGSSPSFRGWKFDASEFDPSCSLPCHVMHHQPSSPSQPRPIFTKPIINPDLIHLPQHILLIRSLEFNPTTATIFQPFIEALTIFLGSNWEVRTKPTHHDALLICESILQAEAVLNDFVVPSCFTILKWRPLYYAEP